MLVPEEFHDLHTGDNFAFTLGGPLHQVEDADYIDYWGNRMVMYDAQDGLHAHVADHTKIFLLRGDAA